jgi:uridine kinase
MAGRMKPALIGIAGGSGSGKTYLAKRVRELAGEEQVSILRMDQYFVSERSSNASEVNFDHPAHLDIALMLRHLKDLRAGRAVLAPEYDFRSMEQTSGSVLVEARPVVLVEGLFVLAQPMAKLLDLTCFLDVAVDQRLLGRILRDLEEREATIGKIVDRYQRFVRPSYHVFVAPTMQNADIVVDFTYRRAFFTELLVSMIQAYGSGSIVFEDFVRHVKSESYRLGYKPHQAYMPTAIDIRQLARAYPESAFPESLPKYPSKRPRLFLSRSDSLKR